MARFAVLIPSYNRPEFLGRAVESVLASIYQDLELVVSDDCSPRRQEIAQLMERYASDPRLRFVAQPVNLGEPRNRAFLLDSARADWLVILGDDDRLYPHTLGTLDAALAAESSARVFTFGYALIDEHDRVQYVRRAPRPLRIHRDDPDILAEFLVSDAFPYWFYQPATFCMHREVHRGIRPNPHIGMGDDLQYLFDYVNEGGTIYVVPEVLMQYRKMSLAATRIQRNQSAAPLANFHTRYLMLCHFEERTDLCPQVRAVVTSHEFRVRFVYQSAVGNGADPATVLRAIPMKERHRQELLQYYQDRSRVGLRLQGYWRRARFFHRLFGWAGTLEMARVAAQRLRFRVGARLRPGG